MIADKQTHRETGTLIAIPGAEKNKQLPKAVADCALSA